MFFRKQKTGKASSKERIVEWAKNQNVKIHCIEYVSGDDKCLAVYIFFETDSVLKNLDRVFIENLKQEAIRVLKEVKSDYSIGGFVFDSHENVVRTCKGNYFLYLR